jgi:predicted ATPase
LGRLIPQISATRVLGLFSFRPAFQPPWENHPHVSHLNLPHLNQTETAAMIQKIAGSKNLPDKIIAQLTGKSDGVPLFVEEITQMVLESEYINQPHDDTPMDSLPPLVIPATLHDLLMARLDRLAAAKEVAQLGAAIGREFTYDLLQAISPLNEFALRQELSRLVEAGLLYQKGAKYIFKHALIRDAAYDSLLKSKRQQYHQQIAQVLSTPLRKFTESSPELVAYHQTAAERE